MSHKKSCVSSYFHSLQYSIHEYDRKIKNISFGENIKL